MIQKAIIRLIHSPEETAPRLLHPPPFCRTIDINDIISQEAQIMEYKIGYRVQNVVKTPRLSDAALDGEIGARFDRFIHERISGKFAVDEILREAEECFRDKYDDEFCAGKWRGEFWGKQILSAVRVCRMKNDPALKEDIRASAYRMLSCQGADGYLGTYLNGDSVFPADIRQAMIELGWECDYNWNIWGQKYTLWALIECACLLDDRYILACCERMADHLLALIDRLDTRVKDTGVMHGMASCSIMKPMLVLYRLTGRHEYLDFCLKMAWEWERADGECPNLITNAMSDVPPEKWYEAGKWYPKAYEMTSCFDGLIELYRVTGEGLYLKATKSFWEMLKKYESNILGSVGYCERYASAASYADAATEICDVIHWMRLSHELFMLTGEAKYMDAFEKAFLNAFLAGVYEDGLSGAFFVRSAGRHWDAEPQVELKYQHCCVNNVARGFVNAAESAVTECADGYMINLYLQTRVKFQGTSFRVSAGYTDRGGVSIIARGAEEGKKLYLRMPEWSGRTIITQNGEETTVSAPGTYYPIGLPAGDCLIQVRFDMTPEVIDLTGRCGDIPTDDYHAQRWVDANGGLCGKEQMLRHPMSVIRRGPVMLARSKKLGCAEEDMFSGETVHGRNAACTAQMIRHDRMLVACRVMLKTESGEREYLMCDYASAANRPLDDPRFFTMYV